MDNPTLPCINKCAELQESLTYITIRIILFTYLQSQMKRILITYILLLAVVCSWSNCVEIPRKLLGRDYVIASRVERVSRPMELGTMKIYSGLRVYNPQLVRFSLVGDSLFMTADDDKHGPQRLSMPVMKQDEDAVSVDMSPLFLQNMRGVDVISGRLKPGRLKPEMTKISLFKGDATHLEVSVDNTYATDSLPFTMTQRKSLLLLPEESLRPRPRDARLGYKSTNNKHIDRFHITGKKHIVFYVSDDFSPLWKKAIMQGIEDWNIAFATIGYPEMMKAMTYSEAGDGFDPFDITNNCFYMVDSDFANAMGCHWTDPRNGEILQADVQFYAGVGDKLRTWMLLQTGAYNSDVADGNVPDSVMLRMLRYAAAHEIGHCLGLEHNFRASYSYPTECLRDPVFCRDNGTTPSIMDYARFNYVAQPKDGVRDVFPPLLGEYDVYAVKAGYADFVSDEEYTRFIDENQKNERCLYAKAMVKSLPSDVQVQQTDLGNNHVASSEYGIRNIASLPKPVLEQLRAEDIHNFYFQLLMHTVPCIDMPEAKRFLEKELNSGYLMLNSDRMKSVFGDQRETVEQRRQEFVARVRRQHELCIENDPVSSGMWMPHQMIEEDVFAMLKKDGIRLSKKEIYNINKRCVTGAALSLSVDNGVSSPYASASFVSKDGLVLTNFHCVSNYVQQLAKGDNDYMTYGCWAEKREQEAPLFNLQMHQLLSIEDVTAKVLDGTSAMNDDDRDALADKQARSLMNNSAEPYGVSRKVYSLMGGQQYILARYRTFSDVRIVACPPLWLGAYGGDDDNWKWPRYSCDFAFLRVYVSPEGEPSDYSKDNVPFQTKSYLKLAKQGVKENDLAMVMGYPSQTRKNIPAFALDKIVNRDTQLRANALKAKIDYLRECSKGTEGTRLSGYNVRIGKLMNVYLRSKGEIEGVRSTGLVDIKRREDMALQLWIDEDASRRERYGADLIHRMDSVYGKLTVYNHMDEAFSQFVGSGAGIIPFAGKFEKLLSIDRAKRKSREKDMQREITEVQRNIREFFPSISMKEDCGMMKTLLPLYVKAVDKKYLPEGLQGAVDMDRLYATSLLTDSARLERFLEESIDNGTDALASDSLYRICLDIYMNRVQKQNREAAPLKRENMRLYGIYMRAKAEMMQGRVEPYEANHTLRFSTGRVKQINSMADMALRSDYLSSKFRKAMADGSLPVACFTTNAETASGNSGSAVLNARGELIGLNFDRTAESTYSIYRNDPMKMRNIVVSIDYILWVIKNVSRSQYILSELE